MKPCECQKEEHSMYREQQYIVPDVLCPVC